MVGDDDRLLATVTHQEARRQEDHRQFRNVLAVIRAMARRTADDSDSVEDYCGRLDGRLAAYIQVQSTILRDGDVDLEMMLADELLRFGFKAGEDVDLVGPAVAIDGQAAGLFALAVHDLIADLVMEPDADTAGPRLSVSWSPTPAGDLSLDWITGPQTLGGRRWSGWLQQALEHQLSLDVQQEVRDGRTVLAIRLPADRVAFGARRSTASTRMTLV